MLNSWNLTTNPKNKITKFEPNAEFLKSYYQPQEQDHETCTNLKKAPLREGPN